MNTGKTKQGSAAAQFDIVLSLKPKNAETETLVNSVKVGEENESAKLRLRITELEHAIDQALKDIYEASAGECDSIANAFIGAAVEWLESALSHD